MDAASARGGAGAAPAAPAATAAGDVRGILYSASFIALIYANYTLLRPYLLLFVNAALVSTALRPVKRRCVLLLRALADGGGGVGGCRPRTMAERLLGAAASRMEGTPRTLRRLARRAGAMRPSTIFLLGSACAPAFLAASASARLDASASAAIAGVMLAGAALLAAAAAAGLLLLHLVDRRIFWYRAVVSDDALVSVCLVLGIPGAAAAIALVLAVGGAADVALLVTSAASSVRGYVASTGPSLGAQARALLERADLARHAERYGIAISAGAEGPPGAGVSLGRVYGFSTSVDVGRLAAGVGVNATESPHLVSALQSAAEYVGSIHGILASGDAADLGAAGAAARRAYEGARSLAAALLSPAALRRSLGMMRALLGGGLGRALPLAGAVVGQSAGALAGALDHLVFVSLTVEMLAARSDAIVLLIDFVHPDAGGRGARLLAEEVRASIEAVIFFPLKLAATRCCCTLAVLVAAGARCVFLGAFVVTAAALAAPAAVPPTLLLLPWGAAVALLEHRYLAAAALLAAHYALLSCLEDAVLSTGGGGGGRWGPAARGGEAAPLDAPVAGYAAAPRGHRRSTIDRSEGSSQTPPGREG